MHRSYSLLVVLSLRPTNIRFNVWTGVLGVMHDSILDSNKTEFFFRLSLCCFCYTTKITIDLILSLSAETSSGCSKGTEKGASGRRVVSVEWIEGAIEGAAEKERSRQKGCVSIFGERCEQSTSRGSSEGNSDERQRGGVNGERRVA